MFEIYSINRLQPSVFSNHYVGLLSDCGRFALMTNSPCTSYPSGRSVSTKEVPRGEGFTEVQPSVSTT